MKFVDLFARLDESDLAQILGPGTVKLLRSLDSQGERTSRIAELALEVRPPSELLRDGDTRRMLFERLPKEQASELAVRVGKPSKDPWAALNRTRIRMNSTQEAALFDFFNLDVPVIDAPELPAVQRSREPAYPLFSHQRRAASEVAKIVNSPKPRVLLHMPTGSGKTRTAMNSVVDKLRQSEPTVVVWLAYADELCEQAASEFETAWLHLGNRELNTYRLWGDRHLDVEDIGDGLLVMGLSKAHGIAKKDHQFLAKVADRSNLIVFDEAHQAAAATYSLVLDLLTGRDTTTALIGLSATPGRSWDDRRLDRTLAAIFDRQKVTLNVAGYDNPVDYLTANEYLAIADFEPLEYESAQLTDQLRDQLAESLDVPSEILRMLADDDVRNLKVIDKTMALVKDHSRVLIFTATLPHAYTLATVLRARGINSSAISGETEKTERRRLIDEYKSDADEPIVLCNYGVLATGFDAPRTSAAVIARPTKSLVLYSQMVGRALRGPKAGGNRSATIVTVLDSALPGFGSPRDAFTNWEDVWQ